MTSRISIVRECLTLTGNNLYGSVDDGSPEWNVSTAAFDAGVRWLYDEHDWNFATEVSAEIDADVDGAGDAIAPADPNFAYRLTRPDGALHIVRVMDDGGGKLSDYRIVGNKIYANVDTIIVEMVVEPDPDDWPGLFVKALTHSVMSGIYRGLSKDAQAAQREEQIAHAMIAKSRPRTDLQEPGKVKFTSTLATARRRRRG